jgi:hypothetical protein
LPSQIAPRARRSKRINGRALGAGQERDLAQPNQYFAAPRVLLLDQLQRGAIVCQGGFRRIGAPVGLGGAQRVARPTRPVAAAGEVERQLGQLLCAILAGSAFQRLADKRVQASAARSRDLLV